MTTLIFFIKFTLIQNKTIQSTSLFWDTYIVLGTVDIFVISQPKWLKFGVQAHLFKMIGHTKFQLSISCTFQVMKLLVEITKKSNSNFLHKLAYHSSSVDFSAKVHG